MNISVEALQATILNIVDDACWAARKWGHDDNGLDNDDDDGVHDEARTAAAEIVAVVAEAML